MCAPNGLFVCLLTIICVDKFGSSARCHEHKIWFAVHATNCIVTAAISFEFGNLFLEYINYYYVFNMIC